MAAGSDVRGVTIENCDQQGLERLVETAIGENARHGAYDTLLSVAFRATAHSTETSFQALLRRLRFFRCISSSDTVEGVTPSRRDA